MRRAALALMLAALAAGPALADSRMAQAPMANVQLDDPEKEKQARALMESIRCLVCQGQSIADSDAEMAADMRALIRERMAKGEQPEAIRQWLIERYGDYISYAPTLSAHNILLWATPLLFLGVGVLLVRGRIRRRKA
jgi:cytochrome c-type biogenesis protein CcmH